jgi:hypothetical protein
MPKPRKAPGRASSARLVSLAIGGRTWTEVSSLVGSGPRDRIFVVETGTGGTVSLRFGDGTQGARLPKGGEVEAHYRVGHGRGTRVTIVLKRAAAAPTGDIPLWRTIRIRRRAITFQR